MSGPRPWRRLVAHGDLAVLLIRHGHTAFNGQRRLCGAGSDPSLDERGREQALLARQRFAGELDLLYCSPQRRARETAALMLPELEPTVHADLRELDQGELEGRAIAEAICEYPDFFAAWRSDPSEVRVPGGETMRELADRVDAAMAQILERVAGDRSQVVAVISHQMAQAAFACKALDRPLSRWNDFELRNAGANLLAWDGRGWSLQGRNL